METTGIIGIIYGLYTDYLKVILGSYWANGQ